MKKKFIAGLTLGLSLFANLAFAEVDTEYVKNRLTECNGWPIAMVCTGSDVNLRTEANTSCNVVTMLQKGDIFYVKEVIDKPDYVWFKGVSESGHKGYMVSKYFNQARRAAVTSERFRAAFVTSTIYDISSLAQELGIDYSYDESKVEKLEKELFHYADYRFKLGNHWIHGEKEADSFWPLGVIIAAPGYKVAGLEVGQKISVEDIGVLDKNMTLIGWDGGNSYNNGMDGTYWYYYDTVDGMNRPVEGFAVFHDEKRIIKEIRYWHIPID